jgi:hypothetical protein
MDIWPIHSEPFVQVDVPPKHSKRRARDVSRMTLIWVVVSEFIHDKDAPVCRKRGNNARNHRARVRGAGCCYEGTNRKKDR